MLSRSKQLLGKAKAAMISAIEIYNKPDFAYREETFAILAINAWELLLKAKVLADNNNQLRSVWVYERRKTKLGGKSKKLYIKRNRAKNPQTMGLGSLIKILDENPLVRFDPALKDNLQALIEIRDNAVHFMNAGVDLAKQVLEIGTASLRNFVELVSQWFQDDLPMYVPCLMPIGFLPPPGTALGLSCSKEEAAVVEYVSHLIRHRSNGSSEFSVALDVNLSFTRTQETAATRVTTSNDPDAMNIHMSDEVIRERYRWDYTQLTTKLKERYIDFEVTNKYHRIRKAVTGNPAFVHRRLLDPENPRSQKKDFYNPDILRQVFDKEYTRR